MRFTVVIPLYNKRDYIRDTLASVLAQSYGDYEVVIVDDGSQDDSFSKIKDIQSERVRVIRQAHAGVSAARNTGIREAKGEYIAFLDADDRWYGHYLQTVSDLIDQYPQSDIYVTAYRILLAKKTACSHRMAEKEGCLESYWLSLGWSGYDFVWTSATTVRRSALIEAGGFREGERIGQDLDMWARVARNNAKVAYSAEVCVDYVRDAAENARSREKIAYAAAFIQILEEELANDSRSAEEKRAIGRKYRAKMTAYIFTLCMHGERGRAKQALARWKAHDSCCPLRWVLGCTRLFPAFVLRWIYALRLRVF